MTGTGPASAVYTIHDKELKAAQDPREVRRSLEASYSEKGSVYRAATAFGVDDIIEPPEARPHRGPRDGLRQASTSAWKENASVSVVKSVVGQLSGARIPPRLVHPGPSASADAARHW